MQRPNKPTFKDITPTDPDTYHTGAARWEGFFRAVLAANSDNDEIDPATMIIDAANIADGALNAFYNRFPALDGGFRK